MVTVNASNEKTAASGKVLQGQGVGTANDFSTATYPATAGTSGKILISDGTNIVSSTPTYPNTSGSAGVILRSDGTNNVYTTATYPATTTVNQVLYSSATNTVGGLTTANNAVLGTDGSGVPSITTAPRVTSITFDGTNLLSAYTTNTFTPAVAFGGGTTGITYTSQTGKYWKIGAVVYIVFQIVLSNKGSSTGNMTITGLPFTSRSGEFAIIPLLTGLVTFSGVSPAYASVDSAATTATVYQGGQAGAIANITNTAISNTSVIDGTGFYFTA